MATQSVPPSTVPVTDKTLLAPAPSRSLSTGIILARQTSSSTINTPSQTQPSDYPSSWKSTPSSSIASESAPSASTSNQRPQHQTDPFSRLSPQAIGAIVFIGALVTVLCLAASFLLLRRNARMSGSITSDSECQSALEYYFQATHRRSEFNKEKPRPLGLVDQTSNVSTDSIRPPSTVRCRMTYLDQTSTSPPWSMFLGRGNSSILNWKPHDGLHTPLRLSSDTAMVMDPWIRQPHPPVPPLPSHMISKIQDMRTIT